MGISENAAHGASFQLPDGADLTEHPARIGDPRQDARRDAEDLQEFRVPAPPADVHQLRPGRVAGLDEMRFPWRAHAEPGQQVGVDRAEGHPITGLRGVPVSRSHSRADSRWVLKPTAAIVPAGTPPVQSRTAWTTLSQSCSASCSTQPRWGNPLARGAVALRSTVPVEETSKHLVALVPWSMASTQGSAMAPRQDFSRLLGNVVSGQAEILQQETCRAGGRERPGDAEDAHRDGPALHDQAGDGAAQPAGDGCLLDCHDGAGFGRGEYRVAVNGGDGGHV